MQVAPLQNTPPVYPSQLVGVFYILGIIFFLIPSTLLYVFGEGLLIFSIFYTLSLDKVFSAIILPLALLLPGYGLFSLWWIVFKLDKINPNEIPFKIYLGQIIGGISCLVFLIMGTTRSSLTHILTGSPIQFFIFGAGPFIILTIQLFFIYNRKSLINAIS